MTDQQIFDMAPCLESGPLGEKGLPFVKAALEVPKTIPGDILKTWATYYVFRAKEEAFNGGEDPTGGITTALAEQQHFLQCFQQLQLELFRTTGIDEKTRENIAAVELETGNHYGNLFKAFDADKYFGEAAELLGNRLRANDIFPEDLGSKTVLDAGCGGGRYSAAWKQLGAGKVVGADFSEVGIASAKERLKGTDLEVHYQKEDVLDMSFDDDAFDIVFSNGVLHHTRDCEKGIHEMVRVLKPGGMGWLYLIENPGGYFWDTIEILRVIMKDVSNEVARAALHILNVPTNRIFYILDHIMVPINLRLTDQEIRDILTAAGAKGIKRLERGHGFDRVERIYQKDPYAEMKYGVGEHRYVFSK